MEENAKARDPEEQAVITRQRWELSYGRRREDRPGPLPEGYEPARDQFDPPLGKMSGHRCDGWRRMTGDEGYFAACSCGWRSTEWSDGIVAAAGGLAAIAHEVALAGQDLGTCYRSGSAEYRRLAGEPANRHDGREMMAG